MKLERYFDYFHLLSALDTNGLRTYPVANGVAISKGDVVILTSGYANPATTLQGDVHVVGVAVTTNTAAEASANGAVNVQVVPLNEKHQFAVPVNATDLITLAQVGLLYDIQNADDIDEGDAVTLGWGFRVDAIDVSAEAIAANAFGFAIGHFEYIAAS